MCKGKDVVCTELGSDPMAWPKFSPLWPLDWFEEQLDIFELAVRHYVTADKSACLTTLSTTRSDEMRDWYVKHGTVSGNRRAELLKLRKPLKVPSDQRDAVTVTKILEDRVFLRDGFRCRYCGIRMVSKRVLEALMTALNSPQFRRGGPNKDTHGILCVFFPGADHVVPRSLGGRTDVENLVTACPPCNFGKGNFTLEQIGVENPLRRDPVVDGWDGLTSLLAAIKSKAR